MNEIILRPAGMPMSREVREEHNLTDSQWRVLVDQIFPNAKTQEAVAMALGYCKTRKLDVFKRPVHIVPMYNAALKKEVETVWPGISEIRTTAARTGEYAGIDAVEYGPEVEREFIGEKDEWANGRKTGKTEKITRKVTFPEWASVIVYRWVKGQKAAFHCRIRWTETCAMQGKLEIPNSMWSKRPYGQIDKCVEAAALRMAFPEELGNTYAAEEMEGRTMDGRDEDAQTEPVRRPSSPPKREQQAKLTPSEEGVKAAAKHVEEEAARREREQREHEQDAQAQSGRDNIVDAEAEEIIEDEQQTGNDDDGLPLDATEFLDSLDTELAAAPDAVTLEEILNRYDAEARFTNDPANLYVASAMIKRYRKRVGG